MDFQKVISAFCQLKFAEDLDDIQKTIIVKRNLEYLKQKAIFVSMFNCPSMPYLILIIAGFVLADLSLCLAMANLS